MTFKSHILEGDHESVFFKSALRSRSNRPHVNPLPYSLYEREEEAGTSLINDGTYKVGDVNKALISFSHHRLENLFEDPPLLDLNKMNAVHNKALNKVADELSYVQNMFEAWYERKEAYTLLGQAGKSLLEFVTSWRKPSYWRKVTKMSAKKIRDPSSLPEAWLLANFAIKPLIGTVDDCLNLLLSDFPIYWVDGSSSTKMSNSYNDYYNSGYQLSVESEYIVKHGVRVKSLNPNAALSNIMGLTTPVSSFLNVVPWFWAVNYFVNVNDVVSNFEVRFPGVDIDSSYTTVLCKQKYFGKRETRTFWKLNDKGQWVEHTGPHAFLRGDAVHMRRSTGTKVPDYKLQVGFPALGSNQVANLFSAIALTLKGKRS